MSIYLRKLILIVADIVLVNIAALFSLLVRFDTLVPQNYLEIYFQSALVITIAQIGTFYLFGLYRSLWKYASVEELLQVFITTLTAWGICCIYGFITGYALPVSVYLMAWIFTCMLVGGVRISYRLLRCASGIKILRGSSEEKRVMIVGAGRAGSLIIKELKEHRDLKKLPVVAIDDEKGKNRTRINGIPVRVGREKIREYAELYRIDEIIITIPSASKREIAEIIKYCNETRCKLKTLPGVYELINGQVNVRQLRDVNIEDLLGREEVKLNMRKIASYLKDEIVLVTGGGGSIGSELCRQIARFGPKKLIIFDIYENNAYDIQNELLHDFGDKLDLEVLIGSCRDRARLKEIFEKYRPGVVFHAAAHKHVPLMEGNPAEAVKNNVFGTLNTARRAADYGAKKFILISTDKAVNPTNIMGASKRLAEIIVQSMNRVGKTKFAAVRFGNVLGSNGSVIPLFNKQIMYGGPVTVTHPDIIRYFMTIPEASQLVIQAGALAKGGEVFVLDMGEPVKIADLARDLIKLNGLEPDVDIKIEYTGLRPGEKLYEELLMDEEGLVRTEHEKIFIGKQADMSLQEIIMCVKALENSMDSDEMLKECMAKLVPTYKYTNSDNEPTAEAETEAAAVIIKDVHISEGSKLKAVIQN